MHHFFVSAEEGELVTGRETMSPAPTKDSSFLDYQQMVMRKTPCLYLSFWQMDRFRRDLALFVDFRMILVVLVRRYQGGEFQWESVIPLV